VTSRPPWPTPLPCTRGHVGRTNARKASRLPAVVCASNAGRLRSPRRPRPRVECARRLPGGVARRRRRGARLQAAFDTPRRLLSTWCSPRLRPRRMRQQAANRGCRERARVDPDRGAPAQARSSVFINPRGPDAGSRPLEPVVTQASCRSTGTAPQSPGSHVPGLVCDDVADRHLAGREQLRIAPPGDALSSNPLPSSRQPSLPARAYLPPRRPAVAGSAARDRPGCRFVREVPGGASMERSRRRTTPPPSRSVNACVARDRRRARRRRP